MYSNTGSPKIKYGKLHVSLQQFIGIRSQIILNWMEQSLSYGTLIGEAVNEQVWHTCNSHGTGVRVTGTGLHQRCAHCDTYLHSQSNTYGNPHTGTYGNCHTGTHSHQHTHSYGNGDT